MLQFEKLYNNAPDIESWYDNNEPCASLIYGKGCVKQVNKAVAVASLCDIDVPRVATTHTSKSVKLPVPLYRFEIRQNIVLMIAVRDNFYDLEIAFQCSFPLLFSLDLIYRSMTEEQFKEKKRRTKEYSRNESLNPDTIEPSDFDWYKSYSGIQLIRENDKFYCCARTFQQGLDDLGVNLVEYKGEPVETAIFAYRRGDWHDLPSLFREMSKNIML